MSSKPETGNGIDTRTSEHSTVVIVDYGLCNLDSVARAVEECGGRPSITSESRDLTDADHLILPGVGAFALAMQHLHERDLVTALTDAVLEAIDDEFEGAAAGVNNAVARVAGLLAVALVGFVLGGDADPGSPAAQAALATGYRMAMMISAVAALGSALIALLTVRQRERPVAER